MKLGARGWWCYWFKSFTSSNYKFAKGIGKALASIWCSNPSHIMLDPFKKGKDKKPLQAAIGGGVEKWR